MFVIMKKMISSERAQCQDPSLPKYALPEIVKLILPVILPNSCKLLQFDESLQIRKRLKNRICREIQKS